ncbi:uncharacterized protein LOC127836947 isoform X6 [Dreissena polymorpha]|uniref:uncharacterized protein LOC127836947 isoform X6 n=1 Tax=Dreissena polymorpha TaxID=45954 RepID=UPI002263B2B0|nr:uncharacterized protein LOC127836947 isoform X6 [Dreissena polymorpha]
MLASDQEITVFSEWCSTPECAGKQGCGNLRCALCTQCLHASQKVTLREAYLEHYNRGGCRRLIPPAIGHEAALTWSPENPDTDAFGLQNQTEESSHVFVVCRHVPERPHFLPVIISCDLIHIRN